MEKFIMSNIQYFIGGAVTLGMFFILKSNKTTKKKNDLTPLLLKLNKQKEAMNKRGKSVF